MNRLALLLRTPSVALRRFDHPPAAEHSDPDVEASKSDSLNIVETGSFAVRMNGRKYVLEPGTVFVTARGMEFSCTHEEDIPNDSCLSVVFGEDTIEDLRRADVPALKPPFARVSTREQFLQQRLATCEAGDEVRLDLLAGALFESFATAGRANAHEQVHRKPVRGLQSDLVRRIDRAIDLAENSYARTLSLDDLSRAANMSAFHFARAFRELTGMPPHRYLTAVRLHHAARMLDAGASVSVTCMETGFGSLSHFINAFRKRYGIQPSDIKRGVRLPSLRASLGNPVWSRRPRQGKSHEA